MRRATIMARARALAPRRNRGSMRAAMKSGELRASRDRAAAAASVYASTRGKILEVPGLAVAIVQPRKYAEHLDVPLQAHEIEPAHELVLIGAQDESGARAAAHDTARPSCVLARRPRDVAIFEQRHQIVGDGTAHGILEIEDAGIGALAHAADSASDNPDARSVAGCAERVAARAPRIADPAWRARRRRRPSRGGGPRTIPASVPFRASASVRSYGGKAACSRAASSLHS